MKYADMVVGHCTSQHRTSRALLHPPCLLTLAHWCFRHLASTSIPFTRDPTCIVVKRETATLEKMRHCLHHPRARYTNTGVSPRACLRPMRTGLREEDKPLHPYRLRNMERLMWWDIIPPPTPPAYTSSKTPTRSPYAHLLSSSSPHTQPRVHFQPTPVERE